MVKISSLDKSDLIMKHSREHWKHEAHMIRDNRKTIVEVPEHLRKTSNKKTREINDANLRRIVACVNACVGIPTPVLETETMKEIMGSIEQRLSGLEPKEIDSALQRVKDVITQELSKNA